MHPKDQEHDHEHEQEKKIDPRLFIIATAPQFR
jgi:hypothetical protein